MDGVSTVQTYSDRVLDGDGKSSCMTETRALKM